MTRLAAVTAACAVLLSAGCAEGGSDSVAVVTTTTETATVTVTETETETVTATTATSVEPTEPAVDSRNFLTPSRNIACLFLRKVLRCDIMSGLRPEPLEVCDFDWVGLELGVRGPATPNCGSDTVFDQGAPTLAFGSTWTWHKIVCELRRRGLRCTNGGGHELDLARGSWSVS